LIKLFIKLFGVFSIISLPTIYAQSFEIQDGSKHYNAFINTTCEQELCDAKAEIKLFKKGQKTVFQKFYSDELTMYLDNNSKPSANVVQIYGEQSPLIFGDFNFDGTEDVAIRNGNDGAYGGPVYDIYVFNKTKHKFVFSKELSSLTQENLGMFTIDEARKRIITFNKSGCCYHTTSEYIVVPKKDLLLVEETIQEATENKVTVTSRQLIHGKWREKVKYFNQ